MSSEIIELSYEQMKSMADEILTSGQAIDGLLHKINAKMVLSIASGESWNADAAREFYDIFKTEADKFPKFLEQLTKYSEFVNQTVDKNMADDVKLQGEVASNLEG